MLSESEVKAYQQNGYVVPKGFRFEKNELAKLQAGLNSVLSKNPTIMPDRLMNPHLNKGKPYLVEGDPVFHWLVHDPRILRIAESVMGPNLILLFTHLFCKPAASSRSVPWHQDGPFWPVKPMKSCTIWVALDDVDAANGAMKVIPGSHKKDALEHNLIEDKNSTLNRELPIENIDEKSAQFIELKAGEVSVHDIGIIHGSAANSSGRRRAGLALRYMPSTSCMNRIMPNASASWEDMPMELVSGANLNRGNDFSLGDFGLGW